jgi:hypothetical protein
MPKSKPMCNCTKAVVVLAVVGIAYFWYNRKTKTETVSVITTGNLDNNLTSHEKHGFKILAQELGWSDSERIKNESSNWWKRLATVKANDSKIV